MLLSRPPSPRKIAVALGVSVVLHTIGGLAWLSMKGGDFSGPLGVDSKVEAPGDDRFAVTLLDPPKREFVVQSKARPTENPPQPLPPVEDVPLPPAPGRAQ